VKNNRGDKIEAAPMVDSRQGRLNLKWRKTITSAGLKTSKTSSLAAHPRSYGFYFYDATFMP